MMTLWNYICDSYNNSVRERCYNLYYYLEDYYRGHHDTWLFVPGYTFPLSLSNISNTIRVNWLYDNSSKSLRLGTNSNLIYFIVNSLGYLLKLE